jgi:hypothetical protein
VLWGGQVQRERVADMGHRLKAVEGLSAAMLLGLGLDPSAAPAGSGAEGGAEEGGVSASEAALEHRLAEKLRSLATVGAPSFLLNLCVRPCRVVSWRWHTIVLRLVLVRASSCSNAAGAGRWSRKGGLERGLERGA